MRIKRIKRQTGWLLVVLVGVLAVFVIVGANNRSRQNTASPQKTPTNHELEEQRVQTLPEITTLVKDLKVVSGHIDSNRLANITVFNDSSKAVQGFAVSSGSFTVIEDDVIHDKPRTLIPPFSSYTIQFPASNVRAKMPLVISGVIYDDDSEAGDIDARQRMRNTRAQQKEKRLSEPHNEKGS